MPILRGRDAEGAGVRDRLAQQVDEGVLDARVLDAGGSEKKPHASSFVRGAWVSFPGRTPRRREIIGRSDSGRCCNLVVTPDLEWVDAAADDLGRRHTG
jgi:hypothetical protein